ncbi:hypothetical protein B0O41_3949 [Propionibacteriaceae bacterium ES.041]|nr:hypothetical protein B0O41_3949 [Propionibacteriaceae bacterium ES.041]
MSAVDRHEKVRADWLLAHEAHWHLSDRRMANDLKRRAAQKGTKDAGAADSSFHEGRIKPLHARFVAGGEDSKDTMARGCFLVLFIVPAVLVGAGPALAFSQAAYRTTTEAALKSGGVPRVKPWLVAAAGAAAAGVLAALVFRSLLVVATAHFYPSITVAVDWSRVGMIYGWSQLTLGLLLTAWQIRRHGWPGVVRKGTPKTPVGRGRSTAPAASAAPARSASVARPEPSVQQDEASVAPARPKAPARSAQPDPPAIVEPDEVFDDEPVFDDEEFVVPEDKASTTAN